MNWFTLLSNARFGLACLWLGMVVSGCFPPFRKSVRKTVEQTEFKDSTELKGYRIVKVRKRRMRPSNVPDMENGTEINQVWIYDAKGELVYKERMKNRKYGCVVKTVSRKAWVRKGMKIPGKYKATPSEPGR